MIYSQERVSPTADKIIEMISDYTGLQSKDIKSKSRKMDIVKQRHLLFYILRYDLQYTTTLISSLFDFDHSTVHYATETFNDRYMYDKSIKLEYKTIKQNLENYLSNELMKIYISGSISNNANYKQEFNDAENYLKDHYKSAIVINPVKIADALKMVNKNPTYNDYLIEDLKELSRCTHIYMLEGFRESDGAMTEFYFAQAIKLHFIYE